MYLRKGFTLVELLVVVSVVGIISAIAIPKFSEYRSKSKRAECLSHMPSLIKSAELYKLKTNKVPCRAMTVENSLSNANCNVAPLNSIKFPVKDIGAGDISKFYYTYGIRPSATTNITINPWYPTPGVNKDGATILTANIISDTVDLSGVGEIAVTCAGKIYENTIDELVLLSEGTLLIFNDDITGGVWAAGKKY